MATIHKYKVKSGPRWAVMWRDQAGKQHRKVFRSWGEADDHRTEVKKEVKDGVFREVKPELMKVVFERWLSDELEVRLQLGDEMKPSTAATYRSIVRRFIREFGEIRSDRFTASVVSKWRRKMARKVADGQLSKKTYNNAHNLLGNILAWARKPAQGFLRHDPMEGIDRMKIDPEERRLSERDFLEPDEQAALLKAITTTEESAAVHLALFCGLRRGELLALKWSDIEWGNGSGGGIKICRAISGGEVVGSPKTDNSRRTVDAAPDVLEALERHQESALHELARQIRHTEERLQQLDEDDDQHRRLVGSLATFLRSRELMASDEGYLFPSATGERPLDPDNFYTRRWLPLRKRAKLRDSIGMHSCRHTYASLLIDSGESIKYVSMQLGHSSAAFTLDRYTHCFKETSRAAVSRLQETIRATKRRKFQVVEGRAV